MVPSKLVAESPAQVGLDEQKVEALFERVEREVREGVLPAAQVAIARHGKLAAMRTFGRVLHEGAPQDATNDTLFCVFSSTKALTSVLLWQLIEQRELALDERVADIVPGFGENGKGAITVEQLLTHTAGFPSAPMPPLAWVDPERRVARFAQWRLNWEPGSRCEYHPSSSMYVAADVAERRTGKRYPVLIRERIAKPLGLEDLWVGLPRALHARVADVEHVGVAPTDAEYAAVGFSKPPVTEVTEEALSAFNRAAVREAAVPGGGGMMTAAELALFYQALLFGGEHIEPLCKPETVRMACEVRTGELRDRMTGQRASRGLGVVIAGEEKRAFRGFGHTNSALAFGHNGAGGQLAWGDPVTGISIGYCTSGHDRNPMRLGRRGVGISSRAASCLAE